MLGVSYSKRTVASYIFDWILIIVFGLICYGLNKVTPVYHPFSLLDLSISYPYTADELISTTSLVLASVVGPLLIIVILSVALVFGNPTFRRLSLQKLGARIVWEINAGLLGLALSFLVALLLTTGMKNIFGKPRPDLLSRCNPDPEAVRDHMVGGFQGNGISPGWVLVDQTICRQTDQAILNDGFKSFPSGHSSSAWSGLLYLALYLCGKFGMAFPFLTQTSQAQAHDEGRDASSSRGQATLVNTSFEAERSTRENERFDPHYHGRRGEGAAPPLYLHFVLFVPIGVAIFICASRWFDYRHHGFDILSGSLIGILSAWYAFNMYQMPLGRGAGWSWGPRSGDRAFLMGLGTDSWASDEATRQNAAKRSDLELGSMSSTQPAKYMHPMMQPSVQPYESIPIQGR